MTAGFTASRNDRHYDHSIQLVKTSTRPRAFQAKYCRSRSVGGVDFDVLRREIGGPHRRLGAAEPQIDREGKLATLQHGVRLLFRGWAEPGAATDYGDIAIRDRDAVRVDPGAGPPDGCHDPAPVRVRAEPGGLDQAGRGDGDGDAHGLVRRPGSCDPQLHELGGPFAVPGDLFGQVEAE